MLPARCEWPSVIARDELATVVADFIVRSEVCPEEFSFDLLRDGLVDAAARRASASNRLPALISRCFERRANLARHLRGDIPLHRDALRLEQRLHDVRLEQVLVVAAPGPDRAGRR